MILLIMNYVKYLNVHSDKKFKEKLKYIYPFGYDLIYDIIELYSEWAKSGDIMIKDPILTMQVDHTMGTLVKL